MWLASYFSLALWALWTDLLVYFTGLFLSVNYALCMASSCTSVCPAHAPSQYVAQHLSAHRWCNHPEIRSVDPVFDQSAGLVTQGQPYQIISSSVRQINWEVHTFYSERRKNSKQAAVELNLFELIPLLVHLLCFLLLFYLFFSA